MKVESFNGLYLKPERNSVNLPIIFKFYLLFLALSCKKKIFFPLFFVSSGSLEAQVSSRLVLCPLPLLLTPGVTPGSCHLLSLPAGSAPPNHLCSAHSRAFGPRFLPLPLSHHYGAGSTYWHKQGPLPTRLMLHSLIFIFSKEKAIRLFIIWYTSSSYNPRPLPYQANQPTHKSSTVVFLCLWGKGSKISLHSLSGHWQFDK